MKRPTANNYHGEWDFDGVCAPNRQGAGGMGETFSLGCFQWVKKSKVSDKFLRDWPEKALKKGKTQKRFSGRCENAAAIYERAEQFCKDKNAP